MEIFLIILLSVIAIFTAFLLVVNNHIAIKYFEKKSCKIPKSFDGMKIALISDTHDGFLSGRNQKKLLEKLEKEKPDYIFSGGDMHENDRLDEKYFSFLEKLKKIAPIYYVYGNHDKKEPSEEYLSRLNKIETHIDKKTEFSKNKEKVLVYGVDFFDYEESDISFSNDFFSIFLCHSPFVIDDFETKPDLMLSGHVHGGFLELPFVGAVFAPGNGRTLFKRFHKNFFFPKYYRDEYKFGDKSLIVSRGLGCVIHCPFRLFYPEFSIITLKREENCE